MKGTLITVPALRAHCHTWIRKGTKNGLCLGAWEIQEITTAATGCEATIRPASDLPVFHLARSRHATPPARAARSRRNGCNVTRSVPKGATTQSVGAIERSRMHPTLCVARDAEHWRENRKVRSDQNAGNTAPLYFSARKVFTSGLCKAATSFFIASESLLSGRATRMFA